MLTLDKSACGVQDHEILYGAQISKAALWGAPSNRVFINDHFAAHFVCVMLTIHTSSEWVVYAHCTTTVSKNRHNVYISTCSHVAQLRIRQKSDPRLKLRCGDAKAMEADENMWCRADANVKGESYCTLRVVWEIWIGTCRILKR